MADFLTTKGVSHHLENIIISAKYRLTLVSPYLQISKTFYERLRDASNRGVKVIIVYGKDDLKPNERNSLAELNKVELYFFENLHAKCYYCEDKMVITSMNMYEFSETNNREMGVLIDRINDKMLFENAVRETESIINSSERIHLGRVSRPNYSNHEQHQANKVNKTYRGYCIRCQVRIQFDPAKPLCPDCYFTWAQFSNPNYQENVCHSCGEFSETSMAKPLCRHCYNSH